MSMNKLHSEAGRLGISIKMPIKDLSEAVERAQAEERQKEIEPPPGTALVGWVYEVHNDVWSYHHGPLDPREVHDNGRPCFPVFKKK